MLVILNTIKIECNVSKDITNVQYGGNLPIGAITNPLLESSQFSTDIYHKPSFAFTVDFLQVISSIFDDIKQLVRTKEFLLARNTSDAIFNACTIYWQKLILSGKHAVAKEFWRKLLDFTVDWENKNKTEIHKGTPYFFLAHTCLLLDDIENTFIYLSKSISEDERSCKKFKQNYQGCPAYSTMSLSANKNNFMYYKVLEVRKYLEERLKGYDKNLRKRLSFGTVERKFFRNINYTEPMIFLNFLIHILRIQEESIEKLDNDFSRVRILNLMFGLCLIIDKTLWIRFSKRNKFIAGNIKSLCKKKGWISSGNLIQRIWEDRAKDDFKSTRTSVFENIINDLLDFNLTYSENRVKKEIQTLLLLWGLRNQGAHRLEKQNILIKRYKDIIQNLMNAFFMSTY